MDVAEADDRALGLRPRDPDARRPVRLEGQAHRPGRDRSDELVEQDLGLDPLGRGASHLAVAELPLEPLHHPVAAHDLDLEAVRAGDGGRVGRDHRDGLDIPSLGRVEGGGRAVRQRPDVRLERAGSEDLAGLVGGRRDDRQADRDPGGVGRRRGDLAHALAGTDELGQHRRIDRRDPPLPVPGRAPALGLVVEREVADLGSDRVDDPAGQAVGQEAGHQQVALGPCPHVRLVATDPVDLRVGLERGDGLAHAERPERRSGDAADRPKPVGPPLIEPDDGRSERVARPVDDHDRPALRRQRHAGQPVRRRGRIGQDPTARLAERTPPDLGVLLRPAGPGRDVRLERDAGHGHDPALRIHDQGSEALGPAVDRQDVVGRSAHVPGSDPAGTERPVPPRSTSGSISPSGSKRAARSRRAAIPSSPFSTAR